MKVESNNISDFEHLISILLASSGCEKALVIDRRKTQLTCKLAIASDGIDTMVQLKDWYLNPATQKMYLEDSVWETNFILNEITVNNITYETVFISKKIIPRLYMSTFLLYSSPGLV